MTSVFQARRRAEEFAAAVDGDAENGTARGQELTTLLGLVAALREQPPVEPRAEFAADLRSRLMLEAETALRPESASLLLPPRQRGRRERRLVAAASAFVLVGGTTTMAAAAQGALPGDALYPIKRTIERAEAQLSMSTAGKGRDLLGQASDRLVEVSSIVDGAGTDPLQSEPRVPETLQAFSASASEGSNLLFESFRETGDPESIVSVRSFATEGIATLEALAGGVPSDAQDELAAAAILLQDIDREAAALCGGCAAELPLVEVPGIFLARADVDRALALAATHELDNNHPVEIDKDTLESAGELATGPTPTPTAPSDSPSGPVAPNTLPSPESFPTLLPGLDGGTGKTSQDPSLTGDLENDIATGLDNVVKTLLPDAGGLVD
jgi:hypothetical protein